MAKGLLEVLLDGGQGVYIAPEPDDHKRKRKKKKGPDQSQGQRMLSIVAAKKLFNIELRQAVKFTTLVRGSI